MALGTRFSARENSKVCSIGSEIECKAAVPTPHPPSSAFLCARPFDRNASNCCSLQYRARHVAVKVTKSRPPVIDGKAPVFSPCQLARQTRTRIIGEIFPAAGNSEGRARCRLAPLISTTTADVARALKVAATFVPSRRYLKRPLSGRLRAPWIALSLRRPSSLSYSDSGFAPVGRAGGRSG
jgi:hypothetical protein